MYETYFGLRHRPFSPLPRVDQYFPGAAIEAARQTLARCIQRAEGPGIVIGPSGTGKTLLCQMLAEQFRSALKVALLSRGWFSTRRALLQAVLYELAQPYRGIDEGELRLALIDYLTLGQQCPQGVLLLVDEAHTLPLRLLDEIRMLTNLARENQPCIRLVLAGGASLEERFATPKLDSFSQRIVARCYLEAINRSETEQYIRAQLRASGGQSDRIFLPDACQSVHQATDGVPRLINQLCDHALLLAYAAGRRQLDASCVDEAWADLQQLPTPWNGDSKSDRSGGDVIEFGGLDDDSADEGQPAAASPPAAPLLRIRQDEDDLCPEPLQQLCRIEDALADLDEEFQPAGSIGPEVELVFADPGNPFSEPFEEEELIVDRYTDPGSPEAKQSEEGPGQAAPPSAEDTLSDPQAIAGSVASSVQCPPAQEGHPSDQQTAPADQAASVEPAEIAGVCPDEADMIIVEEGYEDIAAPPVRSVSVVRPHEYRRLFARLRQG